LLLGLGALGEQTCREPCDVEHSLPPSVEESLHEDLVQARDRLAAVVTDPLGCLYLLDSHRASIRICHYATKKGLTTAGSGCNSN
jgi:hypothetical protein